VTPAVSLIALVVELSSNPSPIRAKEVAVLTQDADVPTKVLRKLVPRRLKRLIKEMIRRQARTELMAIRPVSQTGLETITQELRTDQETTGGPLDLILRDRGQGFRNLFFWAHQSGSECYLLPKTPEERRIRDSSSLPIPPKELWEGYAQTVEHYLTSGEQHVRTMREIIARKGTPVEAAGRILDFGCASGRMIRWLQDVAENCEIWGTDIYSSHITWCNQNLSPPFHFATTTSCPHLPFEDRYFGLVYAASVFTHIDDLADAWFQELRRILRPGGRLFITIHDKSSIQVMEKDWPADAWALRMLRSYPEYEQFARSDFGMFTIGRSMVSMVFYDVEYLCRRLQPFFRALSVTERGHWHQTAVLLERL